MGWPIFSLSIYIVAYISGCSADSGWETTLEGVVTNDIETGRSGEMWVASQDSGIYLIQGEQVQTYNVANSDLPSDEVYAIRKDSEGSLWVGTAQGVGVFSDNRWQSIGTIAELHHQYNSIGMTTSPDNTRVLDLAFDTVNGLTWINTSVGLFYSPNLEDWTRLQDLVSDFDTTFIQDIEVDQAGTLWIAAWNGLYAFANGQLTSMDEGTWTNVIAGTPEGALWVGSNLGLALYENAELSKSYGPDNSGISFRYNKDMECPACVFHIEASSDGRVLLAAGAQVVVREGNHWTTYSPTNSALDYEHSVRALAISESGQILIGTENGIIQSAVDDGTPSSALEGIVTLFFSAGGSLKSWVILVSILWFFLIF